MLNISNLSWENADISILKANHKINNPSHLFNKIEDLIFKSAFHCKRGQGIQIIPKHIKNDKELNYYKILNDYIKFRFNK